MWMLIVLAIGIWTGYQQLRPPSPPSESADDYPAYQRMLGHLKAMTVAPHPTGSKEIEAVRNYLLSQIHGMGLEAAVDREIWTAADIAAEERHNEVHQTMIKGKNGPVPTSGETAGPVPVPEEPDLVLNNIWVKLDAPGTDRGILMLAHYDTKKSAPGASDDTFGVSALLEALREQAGQPDLQSDLYFLFTDGEEKGGMGAKAFVKSHPELQSKLDLVLNFDARGNRGGLIMFETSTSNFSLLQRFQSASSRPISFSFLTGLYRKMPNGTDLTSFLDAGYSGLNFAVAEGVEHYHQPTDTYENFNRGTAYHFLQSALEMAEYGGQGEFQKSGSSRGSVFFTFLPGNLVVMSDIAAYLLSAIAVLSSLSWLIVQIRIGTITIRQTLIGTGWLLGTMGASGLLSWGIVSLLTGILHLGKTTNNDGVFIISALAFGLGSLVMSIFRMRSQSLAEALAGLLPIQLLLLIGSSFLFYEISYVFSLSTLGIVVVAILDRYPVGRIVASTVVGPGIGLLFVPICWLVYVLFMLPASPVAIALSVIPVSWIAAFFATNYRVSAVSLLQQKQQAYFRKQ
jgi:hypothetical protein